MAKTLGAASILVDLSGGAITVYHGSDKTLLGLKKTAAQDDWDKLIDFLRNDLGVEWQVED
jgi:hypothetical protein